MEQAASGNLATSTTSGVKDRFPASLQDPDGHYRYRGGIRLPGRTAKIGKKMDLDPLVKKLESPEHGSAFVAKLSPGLIDKARLLEAVASVLRFPPYFGGGWDALAECLGDLDWLEERDVVLVHSELPALPRADLPVYLKVLRDSMDEHSAGRRRRMHVIFDKKNSDRLVSMRTWDEH